MKQEAINLERGKDGYKVGFRIKKAKGEMLKLDYNLKFFKRFKT